MMEHDEQARDSAGARVLAWLASQQKSQTWLADALGVGRAQLWRWISGKCAPSARWAARLEDITAVPARAWGDDDRAPAAAAEPSRSDDQVAPLPHAEPT